MGLADELAFYFNLDFDMTVKYVLRIVIVLSNLITVSKDLDTKLSGDMDAYYEKAP